MPWVPSRTLHRPFSIAGALSAGHQETSRSWPKRSMTSLTPFLDGDPAWYPMRTSSMSKDHGRLEVRRCHVFDQLQCLPQPERWPGLRTFVMLESERTVGNQTSLERRYYISSLAPDAAHRTCHQGALGRGEPRPLVHGCHFFGDDQMRIRTGHAAHNMAVLKQLTLNLIRLDRSSARVASRHEG